MIVTTINYMEQCVTKTSMLAGFVVALPLPQKKVLTFKRTDIIKQLISYQKSSTNNS